MIEQVKEVLVTWNKNTNEREKLQGVYLVIAAAAVVVAGLVGLLNVDLGQRILLIVFIAVGTFLINVVAWSLLDSIVLRRLTLNKRPKNKK